MANVKVTTARTLILASIAGLAIWSIPAAADAAATYKAKCAMCHGADGKGETPMGKKFGIHDFASPEVQKQSDAELEAITATGKGKMPAYEKSLKPDEIKELISYIRGLAKGK